MQKRAVRVTLLALLLTTTAAAAYFGLNIHQRIGDILVAQREANARIDRLATALIDIGTAQQAYVVPGQPDDPWFEQSADALQRFKQDASNARAVLRSADAAAVLQALAESAGAVSSADARARDNIRLGQELMAADVLFDSRETLVGMHQALRTLRAAEQETVLQERARLLQQFWMVLAAAAALWVLGSLALVRLPAAPPAPAPAVVDVPVETAPPVETPPAPPQVDLLAAAQVCTEISRVSEAKALPAVLARAAHIIDASGLIVWMGAGEELFAVLSHGYDARVIARLGAIGRSAENATAAAWRSGQTRVVPADTMSNGAIVSPMFGPSGTIGVLAAEVRHGRERDDATKAVTAMIAAQLATVVAAWPAASSSPAETPGANDSEESPTQASSQA